MSQGCDVLRFDETEIVHEHPKTLPLDLALSSAPGNQFERFTWLALPSALDVRKGALLCSTKSRKMINHHVLAKEAMTHALLCVNHHARTCGRKESSCIFSICGR